MRTVNSNLPFSTLRLVVGPSSIAIAVTALRLIGELQHWPEPLVNSAVCGKAILGVTWLVPVFGVYFALKLSGVGKTPKQLTSAMGYTAVGLLLKLGGTFVMERPGMAYFERVGINFALTLGGLLLQAVPWPALFKVLLAYGYASRIPVAVVQFLAMRGNWGTHYDAMDPGFPPIGFWPTYLRVALVPNIFFMEAYTVIVGVLVGCLTWALARRTRPGEGHGGLSD